MVALGENEEEDIMELYITFAVFRLLKKSDRGKSGV